MAKATKIIVGVLVFAGLAIFAYAGLNLYYGDRGWPLGQVAGVQISGKDQSQIEQELKAQWNKYIEKDIKLVYQDKIYHYQFDFSQIHPDFEKGAQQAIANQSIKKTLKGAETAIPVIISQSEKDQLLSALAEVVNRQKIIETISLKKGKLKYQQPQIGLELNKTTTTEAILKGLGQMKTSINLACREDVPRGSTTSLLPIYYRLSELINSTPIKISFENQVLATINEKDLVNWIKIDDSGTINCQIEKGCLLTDELERSDATIGFSQIAVKEYVSKLSKKLDRPAINAKLAFGKKLKVISPSQSGFRINKNNLIEKLNSTLEKPRENVNIRAKATRPAIHEGNLKKLGIKEKIARGETTFYGSSNNRIHNVRTGAQKVSGNVIGPGEVFSVGQSIGKVNGATGFVQELVIKGNETKKEYGGGLCQVSSTAFRAALQAGFDIVERRNHGYRVGYYEPPVGMDAAIYVPWTDLKFKNNTDHHVLIQYAMWGHHLAFDVYGTDDGRKVSTSTPRVYNIKPAPKAKVIKDPSLKPGERIQDEGSHPGADASFKYKVIKDGKMLIDTVIKSHYQPWGAVYRVGPDKKKKKDKKKDKKKKKN